MEDTKFSKISLAKSPQNYYKLRCYYKDAFGKTREKQISVTYENGEKIKVDKSNAGALKSAKAFQIKFQHDHNKGKNLSIYQKDTSNFVDEYLALSEIKGKTNVAQARAIIRFLEKHYDEAIRSKSVRAVFTKKYFYALRDTWNNAGQSVYDDYETNHPTYKWSSNTFNMYWTSRFKNICREIMKRSEGYFELNFDDVSNMDFEKIQTPHRFLEEKEIEFVKSLPRYKDVMKSDSNNFDYDYKEAFLFAVNTGLRQTDISRLKWKHIRQEVATDGKLVNYLQIKTSKSKFKKEATVPLFNDTLEIIGKRKNDDDYVFNIFRYEEHKRNKQEGSSTRATNLANYLENGKELMKSDIDIKPITFHPCRHTFANKILRSNSDSKKNYGLVANMMGIDVKTAYTRYARYTPDDIKKISNQIEDFGSIKLPKRTQ